jgi:hypothetical protein
MKKLLLILFSSSLFSYTVISHKPIDYFIPEYRLLIDADIKSFSSSVSKGKVHFRSDRNRDFFSAPMSCKIDNCQAVLPALSKEVDKLDYFISVIDSSGVIYKTQVFSVGQKSLPRWQLGNSKEPLQVFSPRGDKAISKINGFNDKVIIQERAKIREQSRKPKAIKKVIQPTSSESLMPLEEYQLKGMPKGGSSYNNQLSSKVEIDFSGVWIIKRSLSSCSSSLSSQKLIKIESKNGKIIADHIAPNGTKFTFSEESGWFSCRLIDDEQQGMLVGEQSRYTYHSFLKSLQSDLSDGERVQIVEFNRNKITFELSYRGEKLWTSYIKQPSNRFYQSVGTLQPQ